MTPADETDYRDADSASDRLKRYARVGRAAGGLAAKVAGNRLLGMEFDKGRHASELQSALGGLKGPLMKVAQILSTIPDMLPEEYMNELAQLQANAPSMGWSFVRRRMRTELGVDWASRFETFEREAAALEAVVGLRRDRVDDLVDLPVRPVHADAAHRELELRGRDVEQRRRRHVERQLVVAERQVSSADASDALRRRDTILAAPTRSDTRCRSHERHDTKHFVRPRRFHR